MQELCEGSLGSFLVEASHFMYDSPACYCMQDLCEGSLGSFLDEARPIMYDSSGAVNMSSLAPLLVDICRGMLYLHSINIVHGGRVGSAQGVKG